MSLFSCTPPMSTHPLGEGPHKTLSRPLDAHTGTTDQLQAQHILTHSCTHTSPHTQTHHTTCNTESEITAEVFIDFQLYIRWAHTRWGKDRKKHHLAYPLDSG